MPGPGRCYRSMRRTRLLEQVRESLRSLHALELTLRSLHSSVAAAAAMAEADAGAGSTLEGELDELQRRYRMMEADRKLYADEVQNVVRKQKAQYL